MNAPAEDPSIAQRHAEAMTALGALLHRAGAAAAFVTLDETQQTEWSAELGSAAVNLAFDVLTHGTHEGGGPDTTRHFTDLVVRDANGAPCAAVRLQGWHGLSFLPALAHWTRSMGRSAVWRHRGETRVTIDGRFPLQHPPVTRDEAAILTDLAAEGWRCVRDGDGWSLTRARRGRDLPMTLLLVVMCVLLLPLLAIVAVVLVARRISTGRWDYDPHTVQPWRSVEESIELRVQPGGLSLRRVLNGREQDAGRWTPASLGTIFSLPDSGEPQLALVESDRVRLVRLTLRGETRGRAHPLRSAANLAEFVTGQWTRRA